MGFFCVYVEVPTFVDGALTAGQVSPTVCLFFVLGFGVKIPI